MNCGYDAGQLRSLAGIVGVEAVKGAMGYRLEQHRGKPGGLEQAQSGGVGGGAVLRVCVGPSYAA